MKSFILLLFFCIVFSACSKNVSIGPRASLNSYNKKVIEYFNEVALGFEFGNASNVTRKYNGQKMKVFVGGTPTVALNEESLKISTEINALASDGFSIEVVQD